MDRETFLGIYNKIASGNSTLDDLMILYTKYCTEHEKDPNKTIEFVSILLNMPMMVQQTLEYPLNYYKTKFDITTVKDKEGNIVTIF